MSAARSNSSLAHALSQVVRGEILADEPLAPKISARVGGNAEAWVKPATIDDLVALLAFVESENVSLSILGGGANTLVGDRGVSGVTLKLRSDFVPEEIQATDDGLFVTLSAGASISRLITLMKTHGMVGAEFLAGIPGTIGGAVTMNAGTKNGECMQVLDSIELASARGAGWFQKSQLKFAYRETTFPHAGVLTRVRFFLRKGDVAASNAAMEADLNYRKRTQPLSMPNFGSVFRNPSNGHAGQLIESAGLKGTIRGHAQISQLHANWIVNLGRASAADVVDLMSLAQKRDFEETGISLVPEVKKIGEFSQ